LLPSTDGGSIAGCLKSEGVVGVTKEGATSCFYFREALGLTLCVSRREEKERDFFVSTHTPDLSTTPTTLYCSFIIYFNFINGLSGQPDLSRLMPVWAAVQRVQHSNLSRIFSYGPARLACPELPSLAAVVMELPEYVEAPFSIARFALAMTLLFWIFLEL